MIRLVDGKQDPSLGHKLMCIFSLTAFDRLSRERTLAAKPEAANLLQVAHREYSYSMAPCWSHTGGAGAQRAQAAPAAAQVGPLGAQGALSVH